MSLFSFQDIMMSVMGVLVLVTLLMALNLWRSAKATDEIAEPVSAATDAAELDKLKRIEEQVRRQHEQAVGRLATLAELTGDQKKQVQARLDELAELQKNVRDLEAKIASQAAKAQSSPEAEKNKLARLETILQIEQRISQLKAEADGLRRNPRVTYLIQAGLKKTPLLIELSGSRVGIGSPNQREPALWLDVPDAEARLKLLAAVVDNYDRQQHYLVMLLKPSAFDLYHRFAGELQKHGFDMGTELLPEDQTVLSDVPPR